MRFLVVTNMYPPHHYGGYELSCQDTVTRWRGVGHDVAVLTTSMRLPGVADPPEERAWVRRSLEFYWDDHVLQSPPVWRRALVERHNQRELGAALAAHRPDVVSVWAMGAMSLGLLTTLAERRIPTVFVVCDDWLVYGPHLDAWARLFRARPRTGALVQRLLRLPTRLPDLGQAGLFCFVSRRTLEHAEARSGWRFPDAHVVPSGIDRAHFPSAEPSTADARAVRPWGWRLLYVGRLDERKGVDTVVSALPLLPEDTTLTLAGSGDGTYHRSVAALAEELGVAARVRFTTVPRAQLRELYRESDVVVFPSRWEEPFGLVPLEAMACGAPVVATGVGGSADFLRDGENCLLFPADDVSRLAEQLRAIADDPELRRRLVAGGLRTADSLTVDRYSDELEHWHRLAAGERA